MINGNVIPLSPARENDRYKPHILVVEDNPDLRHLAVTILKAEDYFILMAADGDEAIEKLRGSLPIDLLFTDFMLPGSLNGVEIAEHARRLRPGIKVLLTSGFTQNIDITGSDLGNDTVLLKKPYRLKELLDRIETILD